MDFIIPPTNDWLAALQRRSIHTHIKRANYWYRLAQRLPEYADDFLETVRFHHARAQQFGFNIGAYERDTPFRRYLHETRKDDDAHNRGLTFRGKLLSRHHDRDFYFAASALGRTAYIFPIRWSEFEPVIYSGIDALADTFSITHAEACKALLHFRKDQQKRVPLVPMSDREKAALESMFSPSMTLEELAGRSGRSSSGLRKWYEATVARHAQYVSSLPAPQQGIVGQIDAPALAQVIPFPGAQDGAGAQAYAKPDEEPFPSDRDTSSELQ